jgi:hypothetical protein
MELQATVETAKQAGEVEGRERVGENGRERERSEGMTVTRGMNGML